MPDAHSHSPARNGQARRPRHVALLALALAAPAAGGLLGGGTATAGTPAASPQLSVIAGTGESGAPTPGPARSSKLNEPQGVAVDAAGNVYIADYRGNVIEKVTPAGVLSVVAGTGTAGAEVSGPAAASPLNMPYKVAVSPAGDLYIADYYNYRVSKVTPAGQLSFVAGTGARSNAVAGPATSSPLGGPESLAFDPAGNLYIGDYTNYVVEKVTPAGQLSIVTGIQGTSAAPTPGPATSSHLGRPEGLGSDRAGNLYIADGNKLIEKVTPGGILSVIAGKQGDSGAPTPGPAADSTVGYPEDLAVAADGTLYIADDSNEVVERITPGGQLSVYAGIIGNSGLPVAGPATSSPVGDPNGVAVDAAGNLFIADDTNEMVDKVAVPLGPIPAKYASLGGISSFLGATVGPEFALPGGRGQNYAHGAIYWTAATGAWSVRGAILAHYTQLGGPAGALGYPTTDETTTPDRVGRYNHFTGAGGASIYWTPTTGAWSVHGAIRQHWAALGWERGILGYPVTDESVTPDRTGRYNHFTGSGGASIYWTPRTGAQSVHGAIRSTWAKMGWERSRLGYPTTDEYATPNGRANSFTGGTASYHYATRTTSIYFFQ